MDGFANPSASGWQASGGTSVVMFFQGTRIDQEASTKEGRPVSVNADYVRVLHPGERDSPVLLVNESHKMRWPQQWAAYEQKREQKPEGTPLDILFPESPAIVENLKELKFFTVEQLANANDSALQGIGMGCREWQLRARKFLEAANGAKGFHKLQGELERLENERDQLRDAVTKLQARLEVLEDDAPRRGPGRPRKTEAA